MKPFDSPQELREWLRAHDIDFSAWGQDSAKTVEHLWAEISEGETRIELEPPRRVVNVVRLHIRRGSRLLIEAHQDFYGGQRRARGRPPSEKMKPGESYRDAALRCLKEELGVPQQDVLLLEDTYRRKTRQANSGSYPGLCTHYTFHILQAEVRGLPRNDFSTIEHNPGGSDPVHKHYWVWREVRRAWR
ncbi:MAG TPA: NUDIX hydrolase [Candidatus Sulfomarinibacteraceae bacterium]|nr:NUDIX hydrolase [Candidatus Sulfomarinibacteraceae bacterium]